MNRLAVEGGGGSIEKYSRNLTFIPARSSSLSARRYYSTLVKQTALMFY